MDAKTVLVPVSGHPVDSEALSVACLLGRASHGKVHVIYVIEVPRQFPVDADLPEASARAEEALHAAEKAVRDHRCDPTAELLQARDPGPAVVRAATDLEAGIVVMGLPYTRQHGIFTLGSMVTYVLQNAPCPVVVVREAVPAEGVATLLSSVPPFVARSQKEQ
ncbi:MAG: universal stress protein [Chloroflexi bacterium]|nr:universal stress protein [Chloroflexota bacterium]